MRTSVDLPDDLLREAKIVAIRRGVTLRVLMTEALEKELHSSAKQSPGSRRLKFPLIRSGASKQLEISEQLLISAEAADDLNRSGLGY